MSSGVEELLMIVAVLSLVMMVPSAVSDTCNLIDRIRQRWKR